MKRISIYYIFLAIVLVSWTSGTKQDKYPYRDAGVPVEKRVADLLNRMTTEEKISQLDMYWGKEVANMDKFKGGPVGLTTIATAVGEDPGTIEEVYEPFLIMEGYLVRTPRGREVTDLAYRHLKRFRPNEGNQPTLFGE